MNPATNTAARSAEELVQIAQRIFARESHIVRVEANVEAHLWQRVGVDFRFVVDTFSVDLHENIARLVTRFTLEADMGAIFIVMTANDCQSHGPQGPVVFERPELIHTE